MNTDTLDAIARTRDAARAGKWPFAALTPQQQRSVQQLIDAKRNGELARWPDGIHTTRKEQ